MHQLFMLILLLYLGIQRNTAVLCPQIAEEEFILTGDNLDSLLLSNYERSPGTEVKVTCLSSTSHKLIGSDILTCQDNGQWDRPMPVCVTKTTTDGSILSGDNDGGLVTYSVYQLLPYIIALVILCLTCILLVILLGVMLRMLRKCHFSRSNNYYFDSSGSPTPDSSSQTDTWIEMASSRNFRCHELAFSRNSMVESLKYKHFHPEHWSGY